MSGASASFSPSARSRWARATNTDVIAAVMIARKATPHNITSEVRILPIADLGVRSPYPTVVTVSSTHHMPSQTDAYSLWSNTRIITPPTHHDEHGRRHDHVRSEPHGRRLAQELRHAPFDDASRMGHAACRAFERLFGLGHARVPASS